jgi:hypothetical protein
VAGVCQSNGGPRRVHPIGMNHDVVAAIIVVVGLLAGAVGYYAGAASRPVGKRAIERERRALVALTIAVVLIVAGGLAIAVNAG